MSCCTAGAAVLLVIAMGPLAAALWTQRRVPAVPAGITIRNCIAVDDEPSLVADRFHRAFEAALAH